MSIPNAHIDIVFEAVPSRAAFETAMNLLTTPMWSDGTDPDGDPMGWIDTRVVSRWQGNHCYIRAVKSEWDALTPPVSMLILATVDPGAPIEPVDPDNPTEAELNVRNIWYKIADDPAAVTSIRKTRPEEAPERDPVTGVPTGRTVKQGLRFASFTEGEKDFRGKLEPSVAVIR